MKNESKKVSKKSKKSVEFYVSKDKYMRATKMAKKPSEVKDAYLKLGGKIDVIGYKEV